MKCEDLGTTSSESSLLLKVEAFLAWRHCHRDRAAERPDAKLDVKRVGARWQAMEILVLCSRGKLESFEHNVGKVGR